MAGQTLITDESRLTRLHVNLNRPTALALQEITQRRDLSTTEGVRQAIGVYKFVCDAIDRKARVQVVEADGTVRELTPLF